jgi:hypothetical protein
MLGNLRLDEFFAQRLQPGVGASLVGRHQPRIADHVGREDGGQAASDSLVRHGEPFCARIKSIKGL